MSGDFAVECFFFFKQKSAYEMRISDWSSDVCSSDLVWQVLTCREWSDRFRAWFVGGLVAQWILLTGAGGLDAVFGDAAEDYMLGVGTSSEERRVGKEGVSTCRYRLSSYH